MILSSFDNRTATAALRRNGSARLALEAGASSHSASLGFGFDLGADWRALAPKGQLLSIFGGSPFCATYASKQGLVSNVSRMPAAAPITLDPSANQEGGA